MADPTEAQQRWAQQFLLQDDLTPIVGQLMLDGKYTKERAKRLAQFAANIRFQESCLENVRLGFMILTEDAAGTPTFQLTAAGKRLATEERDAIAQLIDDKKPVDSGTLARYVVGPDRED